MGKHWMRRFIRYLSSAGLACSLLIGGVQGNAASWQEPGQLAQQPAQENQADLPQGLTIVSSTRASLVLDFRAPAYTFEQKQAKAGSCQSPKMNGYAQNAAPGEPALPFAGVMIGIPPSASPLIKILFIETSDLPAKQPVCPAPTLLVNVGADGRPRTTGETVLEYASTYAQDSFYPSQPVEVISTGMIRSQAVAELRFSPFLYNPVQGSLRAIRQMRVEIQIGGAQTAGAALTTVNEGPFEALLQKSLINYGTARSWRLPSLPAPEVQAEPLGSALLADPVYKIQVDQDGVYQLTYSALQTAGIPVDSLDPRTFQLFNQGVEVPIYSSNGSDSVFHPDNYLLFYGQKNGTKYTDTNVYWLRWGASSGLRMATLDGTVSGSATSLAAYETTLHLEENREYWSAVPSGPQNDHWYWMYLNASNATGTRYFTFQMQNLPTTGSYTISIRGLLKGTSAVPRHRTRISLNSNELVNQIWNSGSEFSFSFDRPQSYLIEGTNTIIVESLLDSTITANRMLVNWFEIDYTRTYTAEGDQLVFDNDDPGLWEFQVNGFSGSAVSVFDITNPAAPARVVGGSVVEAGSLYQINFEQQTTSARRYLALMPAGWLAPLAITADTPSELKSTANGADYIIISHTDFLPAIAPLAAHRAGQNLRVAVVGVQDVYDEFGGGIFDPRAIHSFLKYAYESWADPKPAYVLLVGDGHYDFKDYYGGSGTNFIPPYLGEFDPWIGEAAADNRYVTVSGSDILPDMYIGRLPANSAAETTAMVTKILAYEQNPVQGSWNTQLTFIADNADSGGDFAAHSDGLAEDYVGLGSGYTAEKINYQITHTTPAAAQAAVLNAINQGRLIINYTGHAATQYWASEKLLQVSSITSLTNSQYPFYVALTCQEGYFIHPKASWINYPSLAESMLVASGKGSIASFSPSGFGEAAGHDILARGLYSAIFKDGTAQLGPATTLAKIHLYATSTGYMDLIDTYMLFGDPATRLKSSLTEVLLSNFSASAVNTSIHLSWETFNEIGITGFNIYRADTPDGGRQQINSILIPAKHSGHLQGDEYGYDDAVSPGKQYYYWLELVMVGGNETAGPVMALAGYGAYLPVAVK